MQLLKKWVDRPYTYPILFIIVGIISYLLQLPKMGLYWDDWQPVLLNAINDPQITSAYFAFDRPFSAWTYNLLFMLIPMKPWIWQLLTLVIRGTAILLLIEAFLQLWPTRKWVFRWVGLILLVYPAFSEQPVAVAFNQHFLTMLLFSISLLFTGLALKHKRWIWIFLPLSVLTTLAHLFTMEYFVGLEAVRVVYITILISQIETNQLRAVKKAAIFWLPYLVIIAGFVYWRLGVFPTQFQGSLPNDPIVIKQLLIEPGKNLLDLFTRMVQDSIYLLINSWVNTFSPESIDFTLKANLFSWGVGFLTAGLAAAWLFISNKTKQREENSDRFYLQGFILGAGIIVFGGLPVWVIGRQITEGKWSDRFSLAPMIGAVLLLVLFIDWLIKTQKQKHFLLALLLGVSIAFQIRTVNRYKLDWDVQKDFYWQLYWRAPALKAGTAILAPGIPSGYISDYAAGYGLNVLYASENLNVDVPFWFFTPRYLDLPTLAAQPQQEIQFKIRNIQFSGLASNIVSLYYHSSTRCLKVLDAIYQGDPFLKTVDPVFFKLSDPSQIISPEDPKKPSLSIFGKEPIHGWCYYFQKADFARQNKQWQEVINLMNEAFQKNLKPATGSELLPLLDANLNIGNWDEAINVSNQMITITDEIKPAICSMVNKYENTESNKIPPLTMDSLLLSADCR